MKQQKKLILLTLIIFNFVPTCLAQDKKFDQRQSITFGLVQPLLGGFNVTYTRQRKRFLFAYSHGTMLNLNRLNGAFKSKSARELNLDHLTFISTGFDLGYRILPDLSIRGEWKWHFNDLQHPSGEKIQYQTITVGPSLYYQWIPFRKSNNILSGITLESSIRWWPVVYSSLEEYSYDFTNTSGEIETFTHDPGNLFFGASLGWTFNN